MLDDPTAGRLDDAIGRAMTEASIPGAIVGIWGPAGDYVRTFGVADKATRNPMQTDFHSRVGSVTKTFTVTAMLQLVDQEKLELSDPISKYIQGVPSGEQITLRELAQMTSGLITFDDVAEFANSYTADPHQSFTPEQLLGYALDKPLQFPPGTQYQYSNTNIVLLGLVVEEQSGQSLPDFIGEHILAPLKLTHTSFPTTAAFPDPHPQGYTTLDGRAADSHRLESILGLGRGKHDLHPGRHAHLGTCTRHRGAAHTGNPARAPRHHSADEP